MACSTRRMSQRALVGAALLAACGGAPSAAPQDPPAASEANPVDGLRPPDVPSQIADIGLVSDVERGGRLSLGPAEGEHLRDYDESELMTCAAREAGNVDCWGPEARTWPREPPPARAVATPGPVDHLFLDGESLCVVTTDGEMHCGAHVGTDDTPPRWERVAEQVLDFDHGRGSWCVIAGPERHLYCGGEIHTDLPPHVLRVDPRLAQAIEGVPIRAEALAMGERHVCVILEDRRIACMGDGSGGQLGLGAGQLIATTLRVVPGQRDARTLVATRSRTCAQDASESIYCWGDSSAFHPVAVGGDLGRLARVGYSICVGGEVLDCGLNRVRLHPWYRRPPVAPAEAGALRRHSWSRGHTHMLCEHVGDVSRVAACYTDLPADTSIERPLVRPSDWRNEPPATPDDLPSYPFRPAVSARIYQVTSDGTFHGDCDDPRVSRFQWEDDETCPDLVSRGRPIPARELRRITRVLNNPRAYEPATTCFAPHHEIVFFDRQDQPVARLVFCLSCGTMETLPKAPLQAVFNSNMSPEALNLNALCRSTGIGGCLDE